MTEVQTTITLKERIDPAGLKMILSNIENFMSKEERSKFMRYVQRVQLEGDFLMVTYHQKTPGVGRMQADESLSLQNLNRKARHVLAKDIYHDIDIVNAHPTILYQICQNNGWETPELRYYIEHTKEVRAMTDKRHLISIMYGSVNGLNRPYLVRFAAEMKKIATLMYQMYPHIKGNLNNPIFSKMSKILQTIEHEILMKIVEFYGKDRVGTLSFDGLLLYKNGEPLRLEECEAFITEWKIKLEEKKI